MKLSRIKQIEERKRRRIEPWGASMLIDVGNEDIRAKDSDE